MAGEMQLLVWGEYIQEEKRRRGLEMGAEYLILEFFFTEEGNFVDLLHAYLLKELAIGEVSAHNGEAVAGLEEVLEGRRNRPPCMLIRVEGLHLCMSAHGP